MLENLHVKNLALIDETEVEFGPGLNILSGETGAGKSILIGSIHLALGERAPRDLIREGADFALVELTFSLEEEHQIQALAQLEVFPEEGRIVMTRKILSSGRSVCRINGETVSATLMRRVASLLIDIHGQHEHQSLLTKRNHGRYLDAFAGETLAEILWPLRESYHVFADAQKQCNEATLDREQQKRELSFLTYEIEEIDAAALVEGEDEELETQERRLSHGRRILDAASACREACDEGRGSASDNLGRGVRALLDAAEYDERISALADQLQEIEALLSDFNRELAGYVDDFSFSDALFAQVQERLDEINRLKSKYGRTISQILKEREKKEARVELLTNYDEHRRALELRLEESRKTLRALCEKATGERKRAGAGFAAQLRQALLDLNFPQVELELAFTRLDHFTENGWDELRFMISTNPGEPLRPLDTVASGGELSRIMLGLKTILAEKDEIETLIFDEIDSGISGRTAQMVAEKIKATAASHQVICITHLPQIAAMSDVHFLIEKTSDAASTISNIRRLSEEETVVELGRMLGGVEITEGVLATAGEMRELAKKLQKSS